MDITIHDVDIRLLETQYLRLIEDLEESEEDDILWGLAAMLKEVLYG